MKQSIITEAENAFRERLREGNDVGEHTRNAKSIAKKWQERAYALDPNNIKYEEPILPTFDQKIDLLDKSQMCAYEFKVSGKNADSEFYKDIVKILLWNKLKQEKIKEMVFITEEEWGKKYIDKPMPKEYVKLLAEQNLKITIVYLAVA